MDEHSHALHHCFGGAESRFRQSQFEGRWVSTLRVLLLYTLESQRTCLVVVTLVRTVSKAVLQHSILALPPSSVAHATATTETRLADSILDIRRAEEPKKLWFTIVVHDAAHQAEHRAERWLR